MIKIRKKQEGQALVETALTLPLLVMMLLGVGYFGSMITAMHNLSVAARYSARAVAMDSTANRSDRNNGNYLAVGLSASKFKDFAMQSLPSFNADRLEVAPLEASQIATLAASINTGKFVPIPGSRGYAFLYKVTGKANSRAITLSGKEVGQLRGFDVGMGNIFFAVRLKYHLKEIDWLAKYLFLKEGLKIEAISMMPAELPLRNPISMGVDYGLMNMNKGIIDILTYNVRVERPLGNNENDYEDLVKDE
ncbi:pilus assembly protein [bacterium]|nr:MAG: pilus assembly protein [bacterium]